jgi:flagellar basal-body rod modification protein FlgD
MTTPVGTITTSLPASSTGSSTSSTANTDRTQLSADAFLQLLVAQLKYQDPSKPVDTASLMSQTATINQIQTMQQLSDASTAQLKAQQTQTATNLIGKTVTYLDTGGAAHSGYVTAASLSGTSPTVRIGNIDVELASITQVVGGTAPTTGSTTTGSTSTSTT